jgi:molecular chaperone DnaK
MKRVYGIDLGTTYSCIACVDEYGKPVVIPNSEGDATTPSVVYFETAGNVVVGQTAKDVAKVYEDRVVSRVKRAMGDSSWVFDCFDQTYTPQEISAQILRKVVGDAEQETGEHIEDVVITCPAYFGINEKEATKQAGEIAGLNVLYVIPEPTAAAIAYGLDLTQEQVVLVYDLGGGTFDVTIIHIREGGIEVIATDGERELGGADWDSDIADYLAQELEAKTGVPSSQVLADAETYQELLVDAEHAKKTLSSRTSHSQRVQFESYREMIELTREKFEEITAPRLEQTVSQTLAVIARARDKGYEKIDTLLLVGGSTYMPQVMGRIQAELPDIPVKRTDPNQIVAKGAALFGYRCQLNQEIDIRVSERLSKDGGVPESEDAEGAMREQVQREVASEHGMALPGLKKLVDTEIINVSSKSFGIKVLNANAREVVTNLVFVDDKVPQTITRAFPTAYDNQDSVVLEVYENYDRTPGAMLDPEGDGLKLLGDTELTFLRALPKGSPIEVTFELTPDGLLRVHGLDKTTSQEIQAQFETESILSAEAVAEAKSRALAIDVS